MLRSSGTLATMLVLASSSYGAVGTRALPRDVAVAKFAAHEDMVSPIDTAERSSIVLTHSTTNLTRWDTSGYVGAEYTPWRAGNQFWWHSYKECVGCVPAARPCPPPKKNQQ